MGYTEWGAADNRRVLICVLDSRGSGGFRRWTCDDAGISVVCPFGGRGAAITCAIDDYIVRSTLPHGDLIARLKVEQVDGSAHRWAG